MKISRNAVLLGTAATLALTISSAAFGQTADNSGIETVTVTAQRRTEDLQKTPVAVTALSPQQLTERNIQTTQDLMQTIPGLQVATQTAADSGGSATFFLRGMGQQRAGNGSEPAVGVYIDDFYYPSLEGSVFDILDLQQVEVLRGPQGTLFGRNTIGGAILYTTKKPDFDFGGYLQATGGSYDRFDVTGAVNIPLSDNLAVRITAGSLNRSGYVHEQDGAKDAGATKTNLIRGQVRYQPTDKLTVDLSVQYNKSRLSGFPYVMPSPISPEPGSLSATWNLIPPLGGVSPYDNRYASTCDYCQAGTGKREFSDTAFLMSTAVVQWEILDNLTLKSLTSWQHIDNTGYNDLDGSVLPIFDATLGQKTGAASQEFQLNGNAFNNSLNYVGGVYYYNQNKLVPAPVYTILGSLVPAPEEKDHLISDAAYFDATYAITDVLSVLGGVRYSNDSKAIHLIGAGANDFEKKSFSDLTWRAGLQAQWTDNLMSYATVSTGFRPGGFSQASTGAPVVVPFNPEKATSYEIGSRLDLFDNRLRFNPTAFYVNWSDIQVQSVVVIPAGAFIVLQNAAKAHSEGVELEGEAAVTDNLFLYGNLAYLDIHYDSIGGATGITVNSHFERAPKITYALGARYDTQIFNDYGLSFNVNWSYEGSQYSTPTDADQLHLPSYGLLNARIDLKLPDNHWDLGVFATNLTDKVYYVGGVNYGLTAGSAHYDLGRPREFGVNLKYNF